MQNQVKVRRITEDTGVDEQGRVRQLMRVEFMVGEHGPFVERVPKAEYNAAAMRTKLESFARDVLQLCS